MRAMAFIMIQLRGGGNDLIQQSFSNAAFSFNSKYSFKFASSSSSPISTSSSSSISMEVVDLKVCLHCKSCENAVRKSLCKIKGVKCVETNIALNKITVLGYMDRKMVVKEVRKTGRRAEILSSSSCYRPSLSHRRSRQVETAFKRIMPSCFL